MPRGGVIGLPPDALDRRPGRLPDLKREPIESATADREAGARFASDLIDVDGGPVNSQRVLDQGAAGSGEHRELSALDQVEVDVGAEAGARRRMDETLGIDLDVQGKTVFLGAFG